MKAFLQQVLGAVALAFLAQFAVAAPGYVGVKVCTKCHDVQGESWAETSHAKALDSLKAGNNMEAKKEAGLDPAKDYTQDANCVGCHSSGFGQPGGYVLGTATGGPKQLGSVGCESCHGPGSEYRSLHGKAEKRLKQTSENTPRATLVGAGQDFDYEQVCASCHLNYEGSPHKGVKAPFTPFAPGVDAKYKFEYHEAVRTKALHEHYRLDGVFSGDPVPAVRADFQKTAKELPQ